jgi:hypothetical protein
MIFVKVVNGLVVESIVADQEFIDSYVDNTPGTWLETKQDGSIRKNYAGIGYTYDAENDAFIEPKPYNSWVLNETTFRWEAPVAYPSGAGHFVWNEENNEWVLRSGEL